MKPQGYKQVANNAVSATYTSTQPPVMLVDTGWPVGDLSYLDLMLEWYGTTSATSGTAVVLGGYDLLRSLIFETDKHGRIVDQVDGRGLYRISAFKRGATSLYSDLAASAWYNTLRLPLQNEDGFRPYDAGLDMIKSRPTLKAQWGIVGDLETLPGTDNVSAHNLETHCRYLPGPLVEDPKATELPMVMPHLEVQKISIASTLTGRRISLPYGDRIYRRIYISQRNESTFAELATVVTAGAFLSLEVNGVQWFDRVRLRTLQGDNKDYYQLETMPTGWCILDFARTGRINDMMNLVDSKLGTMTLVIDVTSVTNGALWIYLESYKPIPEAAKRVIAQAA